MNEVMAKPVASSKQVIYANKRWLKNPISIEKLISRLGYKKIGELNDDDFLVQRRGERRQIFHFLHISWGNRKGVKKYKLFRINVFA
jgi:hypothetical protein